MSSHAYVTAATDAAAAAPDVHEGTFAPQASASIPARARTHAATAVRLTQIRDFTTRGLGGSATAVDYQVELRSSYEIRACVMRDAATAAPNPLSMLTTVTPEAQLLSAASNAATPPKLAP